MREEARLEARALDAGGCVAEDSKIEYTNLNSVCGPIIQGRGERCGEDKCPNDRQLGSRPQQRHDLMDDEAADQGKHLDDGWSESRPQQHNNNMTWN